MSNKATFKGEFRGIIDDKSGNSNGKDWRMVKFLVMDTKDQYAKAPVPFQTFQSGVIESVEAIKKGREVEVTYYPEGNEYNGNYYGNFKAEMVNVLQESVSVVPEKEDKLGKGGLLPEDDDNDLPF